MSIIIAASTSCCLEFFVIQIILCILSRLKYYHPICNTTVDFMHSICYGVVKEHFLYWFEVRGNFTLKDQMALINKRLLQIQPPSFIHRAPRPLSEWKNSRAQEFLYFILFYAFELFYGTMKIEYLNHLKLLIIPLEILSSRVIKKCQLLEGEKLLTKFVSKSSDLYSEMILKSSFHELLHSL